MASIRSLLVRLLIQSHRWLGIPLSLVLILWFASGIAMMYVGAMPALTPQERLDRAPALDLARVQLTAADAAERLGGEGARRGAPVLMMLQDRPAWRFPGDGNATVFADDGSIPGQLDAAAATRVARGFLGEEAPDLKLLRQVVEPDQWTLSLRRSLPLLKFSAGDARGTELYVSPESAEVLLATTRADRARAWIATIPHWLYFSSLRQNQSLWYRMVVWLSALACLLAVMGLALAFTQWRKSRPLDLRRSIPYRGGMRWHYITGAVFGLFALTWAFSGLLSMEPFEWTSAPGVRVRQDAMTGGPPDMAAYANVDLADLAALVAPRYLKEVGFRRIHDRHFLVLRTSEQADAGTFARERRHAPYGLDGRASGSEVMVDAASLATLDAPFSTGAILQRLATALPPGAPVASHEMLQDFDDYYYSRNGQLPLPVLRVKLGDPLQSWLYIDPSTSQVLASVHRYSRVERWLYNGLHSLDFRFWYSKRPLWDLAMITLLLGGLATSCLGFYYGVRGLRSGTGRWRATSSARPAGRRGRLDRHHPE